MFESKPQSTSPRDAIQISKPPSNCTRGTCTNPGNVAFVVVQLQNGKKIIDRLGRFGYISDHNYYINPQYNFMHWVVHCSECHMIELEKRSLSIHPGQKRLDL